MSLLINRRKIFISIIISAVLIISFLGVLYTTATQQGTVSVEAGATLNVRSGPGTGYERINSLNNGDVVTILSTAKDSAGAVWYKISITKSGTLIEGYVHSDYIDIIPDSDYTTDTDFEAMLTAQNFPEDYKVLLRELHTQYPNWKFEALHTNLEWSTVMANETKIGDNLVSNSSISSWKSTQEGAFNWTSNTWNILSGSSSVQASEAIIKYYMDPRNFLTSSEIFQFEILTYSDTQTIEGVNAIIKDTFMYNKDVADGVTYAQAFMEIGKNRNISPYFLANRVRQEQGVNGTSALISGTYSGYEGYYNYFNIGASGASQTLVIQNGLARAKKEGWNSRYAALDGGAAMVASSYILKGQNTLYLQKFDVESDYNGLYWHQYMQTLTAAQSEGYTARKAYNSMGLLDRAFTFKIPVYKNMPSSACAKPTKDGNPNYKLSSISVNGYSISPAFNMDVTSYSLTVPYSASSINISAKAYASTTKITGTGDHSLTVGPNEISVVATAQNGDVRTYILNVTREQGTDSETVVTSDALKFDGSFVYGFKVGASSADALKLVNVTNGSAKIYSSSGIVNSGTIATGDELRIFDSTGSIVKYKYSVIIFGDVTGDGNINALDLVYLKRHIWGVSSLTGANLKAADVTRNGGSIEALDLVYLKRHVWNIKEIVQQ